MNSWRSQWMLNLGVGLILLGIVSIALDSILGTTLWGNKDHYPRLMYGGLLADAALIAVVAGIFLMVLHYLIPARRH